jgi:uncharacterized protein YbjQ (UPF0145 family)
MNEIIKSSAGAVTGFTRKNVLISTMPDVAGRNVEQVFGLVRGNTIRARHIGKDILAALRTIVGGEITEYTKLMAESREQALDRLADQAQQVGANAVLSVRFSTSTVLGGAAELLAYGTAVKLSD